MPCFLAVAATSFARSASRRIWTICSSVNLLFFIGLSARDGESQHFTHAWSSFWQAGQLPMRLGRSLREQTAAWRLSDLEVTATGGLDLLCTEASGFLPGARLLSSRLQIA